MNTFLKEALGKTDAEMWGVDILAIAGLSEWKTGVKICGQYITINSKGETSYVDAITAEIYDGDSKNRKCIQLQGKTSVGKVSEMIKIRETSELASTSSKPTPRITFEDAPCSYNMESNQFSDPGTTTILSQRPMIDDLKDSRSDITDNYKPHKEEGQSAPSSSSAESQQKHLRDLRKRVYGRIGRYTKIIKVGLILLFFMMLVSCYVIYHFLQTTVYENHAGSKDVSNLTSLTKSTIELAYQAKMMYNYNQGISLNRTLSDIQGNIVEVVDTIRKSSKELRDSNDLDSIQNAIRSEIFPWWYYKDGRFVRQNENLLNILKTMINLGTSIAARDIITETDADFMELYRNCPAEVFRSLNETISTFEKEYSDKVYFFVGTINYTLIGGLLMLSVSQSTILVYFLIRLHKVRKNIWKIIENCPRTLIVSGIMKLKERLESVHGEENNVNEKYENRRSGFIYKNHYCQNLLYASSIVLILISAANIIFINYESLPKITQYLNDGTVYNKWTGLQSSYSMLTVFWVREIRLFPDVIKNERYFTDPMVELDRVLDELIWAHRYSMKSASISSEILDMYHDKSGDGYLVTGLHPALMESIEASKSIAYQLQDSEADAQAALDTSVYVEGEVLKMISMMDDAITIVFDSSRDRIDAELAKLLMFITLIQVMMLMFIVFGIYPIINSIRMKMQQELQILMFLPRDDIPALLRLFSNI